MFIQIIKKNNNIIIITTNIDKIYLKTKHISILISPQALEMQF